MALWACVTLNIIHWGVKRLKHKQWPAATFQTSRLALNNTSAAGDRFTCSGSPPAGPRGQKPASARTRSAGGTPGGSRLWPPASRQRENLLRSRSPSSLSCRCCSLAARWLHVCVPDWGRLVSLQYQFHHFICATTGPALKNYYVAILLHELSLKALVWTFFFSGLTGCLVGWVMINGLRQTLMCKVRCKFQNKAHRCR